MYEPKKQKSFCTFDQLCILYVSKNQNPHSLEWCSATTSISQEIAQTIHSASTFRGKASDPDSVTLGNWRPDERHAISRSAKENLKELRRSKMTTSGYKWVMTRA